MAFQLSSCQVPVNKVLSWDFHQFDLEFGVFTAKLSQKTFSFNIHHVALKQGKQQSTGNTKSMGRPSVDSYSTL